MDNTALQLHALAKAAIAAGENTIKAEVAGCVVTVHADHPLSETAPESKAQLIRVIRAPRHEVLRKHGQWSN